MVFVYRCNNTEVTDFYINVIGKMFHSMGEEIKDYSGNDSDKDAIIIASSPVHFVKFYLKGYRNIILWMQGIEPEESYLINKSILRKKILSFIAKFALKRAKLIFYVSEEMRMHQEKKYGIKTKDRSVIMPCFNDEYHSEFVFTEDKYNRNTFAYVGSLSAWQCFEKTMDIYKEIENSLENTELKVLTFSIDEAKKIIEDKKIKNYTVYCVAPEDVAKELAGIKFGFVIRDDIDVNNVSTPTKISSYLSAGVIPIVSDSVKDFSKLASDLNFALTYETTESLIDLLKSDAITNINPSDINREYELLFNTYYCPDYYIRKYQGLIIKIYAEIRGGR